MTFEKALERLKAGQKMTRGLWDTNGNGGVVFVEYWPQPLLIIESGDGVRINWIPRDHDLFAGDWQLVK